MQGLIKLCMFDFFFVLFLGQIFSCSGFTPVLFIYLFFCSGITHSLWTWARVWCAWDWTWIGHVWGTCLPSCAITLASAWFLKCIWICIFSIVGWGVTTLFSWNHLCNFVDQLSIQGEISPSVSDNAQSNLCQHHILNYCSFIMSLDIIQYYPSSFVFFFLFSKVILVSLDSRYFHTSFSQFLPKILLWFLNCYCIKSIDPLGKNGHFLTTVN